MERTKNDRTCVLCGSRRWKIQLETPGHFDLLGSYRLLRCQDCGLLYLGNPLSPEGLTHHSTAYQAIIDDTLHKVQATWLGRLGIGIVRKSRVPEQIGQQRLLDIGCSSGRYLAWLKTQGWRVEGIERDLDAAERARQEHGITVMAGDAEAQLAACEAQSFDVVTMWHVLEHVHNPRTLLAATYRVLRPGGLLLLEAPNAAGLGARVLGRYWFPLEVPFHNFHFTPTTLGSMLRQSGFSRIELKGEPAPSEMLWSAQYILRRLIGSTGYRGLWWSPAAVIALYPLEWALSRVTMSNHLRARAWR